MSNIKLKSIAGKSVCFYFHRKNCFKEASGTCSLFAEEEFKKQFTNLEEKAPPERCPTILELMQISKTKLFPVYLSKYRCGHYQNGQGQHRICIAGHLGLEIKVIIDSVKDKDCGYCTNPESFILKHF